MDEYYNDPVKEDILCVHRKSNAYHNLYHKHDGYEIYLLLRGNVNIYIEHSCYNIQRGTVCFFNPDQLHLAACQDDEIYERITVNIKPEIIDRLSTHNTDLHQCFERLPSGNNRMGLLSNQQVTEFIDLFHKIKEAANRSEYGADIQAYAALAQMLLLVNEKVLNQAFLPQNIMPVLISDMMQYIEGHLDEPLTLKILSNHFFMSGKYLSRKFHDEMGVTLQEYIISKRILYAKQLLQRDYSVTDTCFHAGFNSYANFIRTFTRQVGISPGQYKKKIKAVKIT